MSGARGRGALAAAAVVLVLLGGLAIHAYVAWSLDGYLDPDEAVVGLMAKHIAGGRGLPVFYYGQPYLGALEAYLVAAGFALGGEQAASARAVTLAIWLALAAATWTLARALELEAPALAVALVCIVAPPVMLWHLKLRGGFTLAAALLALAVALGVRGLAADSRAPTTAAFGVLAGLAFWTNQLTAPASAVIGVALIVRRRRAFALVAGSFAIGSAPFWVFNLANSFATFQYLAGHFMTGLGVGLETRFELVTSTLPLLIGGPTAAAAMGLGPLQYAGPVLASVGVGALVWTRGGPIVGAIRARRLPAPVDLVLIATLVSLPFRRNSQLNQFLHLTPLAAVLGASLWRRSRELAGTARSRLFLVPVAAVLLAAVELALWLPSFRLTDAPMMDLVRVLDAHGVRAVHAEHRPTYLIAFHSGERIAATPSLSGGYDVDRYPPYTARVRADRNPAYVFEAGSASELRSTAVGTWPTAIAVSGYHVYLNPVKP